MMSSKNWNHVSNSRSAARRRSSRKFRHALACDCAGIRLTGQPGTASRHPADVASKMSCVPQMRCLELPATRKTTVEEPMRMMRRAVVAAACLVLSAGLASADTIVKWLHIEINPNQVKLWEEVARDFEAKNPGVKIEMSFLENEAYKAKAPTLLQSKDRPHIIYSWAGGVLKTQVEAGVLEDITADVGDLTPRLSPAAVAAFTVNDRIYGLPYNVSQVGFMYNKELFAKAGVDGSKIATWDDLLGAVKQLKAAGITPIV